MKRHGLPFASVPPQQFIALNRSSPQFSNLVGAWLYHTSRYQSIIRDLALFNDSTLTVSGGGYGWQETDNEFGTGIFSPGGSGGTAYSDAGNDASLQITASGLTICVWVRLYQNLGSTSFPGLIGKGDADSVSSGSYIMYLTSGGKLNFLNWSGGAYGTQLTGTTSLDFQGTYHFAATWQPSVRSSIYVNGLLEATTTSSVPATLDNPAYNFLIGSNQGGGNSAKYNFRGMMHEARLYNHALSADEIYQLWNPPTRWDLYRSPQRMLGYPTAAPVNTGHSFALVMG